MAINGNTWGVCGSVGRTVNFIPSVAFNGQYSFFTGHQTAFTQDVGPAYEEQQLRTRIRSLVW